MHRNLKELAETEFDVIIVGGGIYGAALVREAASRGLRAALVERGDFCGATSANSLKIIHGGLRYLQQADIIRVRESVRERRAMLYAAPHLIRPMPCFMPTTGLIKSLPVMFGALLMNDILSFDRNRGIDPERQITRGRVTMKQGLRQLANGHSVVGSGAAIWCDAIADDTERIVIEMLLSAAEDGACIGNYLEMTGFTGSKSAVTGVKVRDRIDGGEFDIRAKTVINAAGPWANRVLEKLDGTAAPLKYSTALGINVVLRRELIPEYAAGLPCRNPGPDHGRLMFFAPWQGVTMAGTFYRHYNDEINDMKPTDSDVEALLNQLNSALPTASIGVEDITRIHAGLLPCKPGRAPESDPKLLLHYKLIDHASRDGIDGLVSVLGVKYTTARDVAERTINLTARKLGMTIRPSSTSEMRLPGAEATENIAIDQRVQMAVKDEEARTLSDIIYRRTGLGGRGIPDDKILRNAAEVAAAALGWNTEQISDQIAACQPQAIPYFQTS
jgi:glycerol-3-phosphate dehydrogenase